MRSFFVAALAMTLTFAACADNAQQNTMPEQQGEVIAQVLEVPSGMHFALMECIGKCEITVHRKDGTDVLRWYIDEGQLKNDGHTVLDELVVLDGEVFFSIFGGEEITITLISPPTEYVEGPVMELQSMSQWFMLRYSAWTNEGDVYRTSSYAGVDGSDAGVEFDFTVVLVD